MTIFASFSLFLSSLLFLTVPLRTHAQEQCKWCERLPRCASVEKTVEEIWQCMTFKFPDAEPNPPVGTIDELYKWCCEQCPKFDPKQCGDKPTLGPTKSRVPTTSPSVSLNPTTSPMPTPDCVCCDCIKTCTINPDPHFNSWDNNMYDFQGGCDMYAAKNDELEILIATRPRGSYSTITQITVVWKIPAITEYFKISMGGAIGVPTVNTIATDATATNTGSTWTITHTNSPSFIRITEATYGFSLQIQGHGTLFSNSVGMCGDWNFGGVRFSNGALYDTSGGYAGTAATSFPLAQDWKIPFTSNELDFPTTTCDADSTCGPTSAFACSAVRKLQKEKVPEVVNPGCDSTCETLSMETSQLACLQDVALTNDKTWACQKSYEDPLLSYKMFCKYCNRLENCLKRVGSSASLEKMWNCLIGRSVVPVPIPYGIQGVKGLVKQCCTCKSKIAESKICNPIIPTPPPTPPPTTCGEEHEEDKDGKPCNSVECGKLGGKCLDVKKCKKLLKKNINYADYICLGNKICKNKKCRCLIKKQCPDRDD